jgi:hypothetical protein
MITVPKEILRELLQIIEEMEEKGMEAENAAARLNEALGDMLTVAADRSRLAHRAHKLLKGVERQLY